MLSIHQIRDKTQSLKVLVVDDEDLIREAIATLLVKFFEVVSTAKNGAEALELLENNSYDILFTDIQMPIMDGWELIQKIKDKDLDMFLVALSVHLK